MSRRSAALAPILALALAGPAAAHDPAAEEEPEPRWQGSAGLSFLDTSGNTDSQSLGANFELHRLPEPWGLDLVARFHRAEEDGDTTAERYFASLRASRALGERWALFAGVKGEQDEFAGIDLRGLVEVGATYRALLGPVHRLALDLGLTWTDEDRIAPEPDVDSFGAVLGLAHVWKVSETATWSAELLYFPNFDESDDWRLDLLTALTASLTERFAVQLAYEARYREQPIGDNDDTDTLTRASLVVSF